VDVRKLSVVGNLETVTLTVWVSRKPAKFAATGSTSEATDHRPTTYDPFWRNSGHLARNAYWITPLTLCAPVPMTSGRIAKVRQDKAIPITILLPSSQLFKARRQACDYRQLDNLELSMGASVARGVRAPLSTCCCSCTRAGCRLIRAGDEQSLYVSASPDRRAFFTISTEQQTGQTWREMAYRSKTATIVIIIDNNL
jgi:hypothetical protein